MDLASYDPEEKSYFDELFSSPGKARAGFEVLIDGLHDLGSSVVLSRQSAAEQALQTRFAPKSLDGVTHPVEGLNGDIHAAPDYRAHLIGVMARRAVEMA